MNLLDAPSTTEGERRVPSPRVLYTVAQVAEILCIGRSKTYELVMRGDIASITIGRLRRIPASEIARFIDLPASMPGGAR